MRKREKGKERKREKCERERKGKKEIESRYSEIEREIMETKGNGKE